MHVVPTLENSALILFFSVFGRSLVLTSGLGATGLTRTPVFRVTVFIQSGFCGNSRVLGISAVWSTALESGEHA